MINFTKELHYLHKASGSCFLQQIKHGLLIKQQLSTKIAINSEKNYSKQKVYRVINLENFISIHAANYSEQFIYSDNTYNKIEFFRFNQSKSEARTFTRDQNRANLGTVIFSQFYLHIIYPEKINKTDSNITRFIFSFCYRHELMLKFYRQ